MGNKALINSAGTIKVKMEHKLDKSSLLTFSADGPLLHAKIRARLNAIGCSMNSLCFDSGVSFSTTDRWRQGSRPFGHTVIAIESALLALETAARPNAHKAHSKIAAPIPSAVL